MKKLILLFVAAIALRAQVPTISNIVVDGLGTTSFTLYFTVSGVANAWAEVLYGTTSGTYPYNTKSINCYATINPCSSSGVGVTALTVTGLTPGTPYYVRATARPDPDDDMNICNVSGCGAVEQVITTLSGVQPQAPIAPTSWVPPLPNTSSLYMVVPLSVGGTGECWVTTTTTNGTWTLTAHTYLTAALVTVTYGTVFEMQQGVSCQVPSNTFTGYILPSKALDVNPNCNSGAGGTCAVTDPAHRWILFRTHQVLASDFPPFGTRTNADFAPLLAKFYSSQPNSQSQLFDAEQGTNMVHHYWFQNVEFEDDPAYVNPTGYVDPIAFNYFVNVGSTNQMQNNEFLVFDRVYAHAPGPPIRHDFGYALGGNYIAMTGCWTDNIQSWRMTLWPSMSGTNTTTSITVPQNNYRYNVSSSTLGMSAGATVSFSGLTGSGTILGNLGPTGLDVQYTTGVGTLTCTGCTGSSASSPATPPTALNLFSATVSGGAITSVNWNTQEFETSRYLYAFGIALSDLKATGGPYYFDNNYVDGLGEGFYIDPQYSLFASNDITYTHNHHIWPKQAFALAVGNEWRYDVRQHWETKRGHRVLFKGNLCSWSWSNQNDGPCLLASNRTPYNIIAGTDDGVGDYNIVSNIVSHSRGGLECMGGNTLDNGGGQPEGRAAARVSITNNYMFDLGAWLYCDPVNCPGLGSQYFSNRPGCQDLVINNNTMSITYSSVPSSLQLGGGQMLGNYLSFQNNILYFSQGLTGYGGSNFGDWPANNVLNHNVTPSATYSVNGAAPNFKTNLDQSFINTAATVTPNYTWANNIEICGYMDTNETVSGAVDLTWSQCQAYSANASPGDLWPTANTIAGRVAQVPSFNPMGTIGANMAQLTSDQGLVTQISVTPSPTSIAFSYTAPDARACSVDISNGTWVRMTDAGGSTSRSAVFSGLSTGSYQYRILCYYKQVNDGVLYLDYTSGEITNGTVSVSSGRTVDIGFNLPGAANSAIFTDVVSGSMTTCASAPCALTLDPTQDHLFSANYTGTNFSAMGSPFTIHMVSPPTVGNLVCLGDSLTAGYYNSLSDPYCSKLARLTGTLNNNIHNLGIPGYRTDQVAATEIPKATALYNSGLGKNLAVVWAGINNCLQGTSLSVAESDLTSMVSTLHSTGYKTMVIDLTPQDYSSQPMTCPAFQIALNAYIMAGSTGADVAVDANSLPNLQNTANPTYFYMDMLHLQGPSYIDVANAVYPLIP